MYDKCGGGALADVLIFQSLSISERRCNTEQLSMGFKILA